MEIVEKFLQLVYLGQTNSSDQFILNQVEDLAFKHFGMASSRNNFVRDSGEVLIPPTDEAISNPGEDTDADMIETRNQVAASRSSSSSSCSNEQTAATPTPSTDETATAQTSLNDGTTPAAVPLTSDVIDVPPAPTTPPVDVTTLSSLTSTSSEDVLTKDFEFENYLSRYNVDSDCDNRDNNSTLDEDKLSERSFQADEYAKRCRFCGKTFTKFNEIVFHFSKFHSQHNPFKCSHCPKSFTRRFDLKVHIQTSHNKFEVFRCDDCNVTFSTEYFKRRHLWMEHGRFKKDVTANGENDTSKIVKKEPELNQDESRSGVNSTKPYFYLSLSLRPHKPVFATFKYFKLNQAR
jgi:Zinc finger, C2H2 type